MADPTSVTQLLRGARDGDRAAADALLPLVYDELRRIAHQRLMAISPGHTLNTTALVHEAYIRLIDEGQAEWNDRAHFFALASRSMRFILIDYARQRTAAKRGGGQAQVSLDDVHVGLGGGDAEPETRAAELLTLNRALEELESLSSRLSQLVEYRFFGGLSYEEIAEVTGRSVPTIKRDWRRARTWLYQAMSDTAEGEESAGGPTSN